MKQKDFKDKRISKNGKKRSKMSREYKTYEQALRNLKSGETIIYDPIKGVYKIIKLFPKYRRMRFLW